MQASLLDRHGDETRISDLISDEWAGEWGEDAPGEGLLEVLVLRATNLDGFELKYSTAAQRFVHARKARQKRLETGDIVLEAAGGGPGVPVGRVARFDQPPGQGTYLTSNFFRALRPSTGIDPSFLYWLLEYEYQKPTIWSCQQQTTGIINLKMPDYLGRTVRFDRAGQANAARALDDALARIRAEEDELRKLNRIRAGLATDLISGRVRTVAG